MPDLIDAVVSEYQCECKCEKKEKKKRRPDMPFNIMPYPPIHIMQIFNFLIYEKLHATCVALAVVLASVCVFWLRDSGSESCSSSLDGD